MTHAIWRSWKPAQVREAIIDELVANAEIAGKFVEGEARRRLLSIREPAWGEAYRRQVVGRLLTNIVQREAKAVIIWVGVRIGPKGSSHGLWIELGTRTTKERPGHPAHPFLRPAVFDNARQILMLLAGK